MKKSIALIALTIASTALAEHVCLVNWSKKYNIAILSASGKWVQLAPRTRTGFKNVDIDLTKDLMLQACDKGENRCGYSASDFNKGGISYPISKVNVKKSEFSQEGVTIVLDAGYSFFDGLKFVGSGLKTSTSKTVRAVSANTALTDVAFAPILMDTKQEGKPDLNESLRLMTVDVSMIKNLNSDQMFVLFGIDKKQAVSSIDWDRIEKRYEELKKRYNPSNYSGVEKDNAAFASALLEKVYGSIIKSKPVQKPAAPISNEKLKAMDVPVAMVSQLNDAQLRVLFGADTTKDLSAIKTRYKKLMLKFHTDKYQGADKEAAIHASQTLNEFYDTLDSSRQRASNN